MHAPVGLERLARLGGRYRPERLLGSGRTASVWTACDLVSGSAIALKVAGGESTVLRREFERLSAARHAGIVEALDFGFDAAARASWLALERIDGEPLARAAARQGSTAAARLFAAACDALGHLHRRGLAHGDVKPAHLLVAPDGALKLIDLGLAVAEHAPAAPAARPDGTEQPETWRGYFRGTPRYAAPSLLAGRPPRPESDLFALAASFAEAFLGRIPGRDPEPAPSAAPSASPGPDGAPGLPRVLEALLRRLLGADDDQRPACAEAVLGELERALGTNFERAWREPVLAGREPELAALDAGLAALVARRLAPSWWELAGEAGSGKTRLLRELARRARLSLATVVSTSCAEPGPALARVLRALAVLEANEPERAARSAELAQALERGAADAAVLAGAGEALAAAARGGPLLIALDDAERADEATLAVLGRMALAPRGPWGGPWAVSAGRTAAGAPRAIRLERLASAACRALAASLLPDGVHAAHAAERVAGLAEGHARFAALGASALAGSLRQTPEEAPEAWLEERMHAALPAELRVSWEARVAQLGTAELRLARAGSVLTRGAEAAVWEELDGRGARATEGALAALVSAGFLGREPRGDRALFGYASETARRLLAEALAAPERVQSHVRVARACAALAARAEDPARHAEAVVRHALEGGLAELAWEQAAPAMRELLARQEFAAATRLGERLVEMPGGAARDRRSVLEALGDARRLRGSFTEAREAYRSAAELDAGPDYAGGGGGASVRAADDFRLLRKSAVAGEALGELEETRARLASALAQAPACVEPQELAQAWELLGQVEFKLAAPDAAERAFERGLAVLAEPERDAAASSLWNDLGVLAYERGDYTAARTHHARAVAIREAHGDREGLARSLTNLGNVALVTGDFGTGRGAYEQALAIKRRLGNRQSIALTTANLGELEHCSGAFARAIALHQEALADFERLGDAAGQALARRNLAEVWLDKGQLGEALRHARAAGALARRSGALDSTFVSTLVTEARVEHALGRSARAVELAREARRAAGEHGDPAESVRLSSVLLRALGAERSATDESAEAQALQARAIRRLSATGGSVALIECLLDGVHRALDDGRPAEAGDLLAQARQRARAIESPWLEARLARAGGELAARAGDGGEASRLLHRAHSLAQDLGALEVVWRTRAALGEFHAGAGRVERGLSWLERCATVFREALSGLGDAELEAAYLAQPERAGVLEKTERWLRSRAGRREA